MKKELLLLWVIFAVPTLYADGPLPERPGKWASNDNRLRVVEEILVDSVWAANKVSFDLHTVGDRQFVAYYDSQRMMSVASRSIHSHQWRKTVLPSKLMWDSHNYVAMGIDEQGYVHISGNMHTHHLTYFRSAEPYDISNMIRLDRMIGIDEDSVTYPRFFKDRLGRLLFSYRSGTCGNGNILVNRFDAQSHQWVRHLETPLFEGVEENDDRAAYHKYVKDQDGNFHFVWLWRWTPLVETCHQLCYATSPDLIHWKNANGEKVSLPFRPDCPAVIVDDTPSKGGMHNSRYQVILTKNGDPIIGYVKYDEDGLTQLYLARFTGQEWISKKISDWKFRWKFIGGGDQMTEGGSFRLVGISEDGVLHIRWATEEGRSGQYTVDTQTLEHVHTTTEIASEYPGAVHDRVSDIPGLSVNLAKDKGGIQADGVRYILKWESRGKSHGKHAPEVIPDVPVVPLIVLRIQ